jgi:phage terminase Nu1 subunit (DNA packaging protein)
MVENEDWVSLREFARRIGVTPNAVASAIKSGRIERREDGDKKIHWPSQSVAWSGDRDPSKVRENAPEDPDEEEDAPGDDEEEEEEDSETARAFKRAKIRKEVAIAGLKELELKTARGEVVKAAHVRGAMAQFAIDVREAVMTIPDRVASELAAELAKKLPGLDLETARELVHRVWRRESRLVLERIARGEK